MCPSLYFDSKNLWSANFSRIVITALVCATPAHFRVATSTHNIPTSEPHKGDYPSRAVYDLMLSLIQVTTTYSECLGFFFKLLLPLLNLHLQVVLAMIFYLTLVQLLLHQKQFLDFLQFPHS